MDFNKDQVLMMSAIVGADNVRLIEMIEKVKACDSGEFHLSLCADRRWSSRVCGYDCEESTCYGNTPAEAIEGALAYWDELKEPKITTSFICPSCRQTVTKLPPNWGIDPATAKQTPDGSSDDPARGAGPQTLRSR